MVYILFLPICQISGSITANSFDECLIFLSNYVRKVVYQLEPILREMRGRPATWFDYDNGNGRQEEACSAPVCWQTELTARSKLDE